MAQLLGLSNLLVFSVTTIKSFLKNLGLLKPVEIGDAEPVSTVVAAPAAPAASAPVRPCSSRLTALSEASKRSKLLGRPGINVLQNG